MNRLFVITVIVLLFASLYSACESGDRYNDLRKELAEYVVDKDCNIGIAIIIDGKDTVEVNGAKMFPMQSVYKFPIALALADNYRRNHLSFSDSVVIQKEDLHLNTYSPMTEKLLAADNISFSPMKMTVKELLAYSLQQSDNNASDILLNICGGAGAVNEYLSRSGIKDINVHNSENEMHDDISLCKNNSASPLAMASLMDRYNAVFKDSLSAVIKQLMETCETGVNRLSEPVRRRNAVIGHKTGSGYPTPEGGISTVNDAGYVNLPNGHRYAIAVFIENSPYDMEETEKLISDISDITAEYLIDNQQ